MMPLYRDGDILIISPASSVRRGDRVVVRTRDGEVMAKILQRQTSRTIELASVNPDFPDRQFQIDEVEWVARILWASQ
jgi:phage repressor protein C with HTH and peptisase S24 domain